jgi:SAM-dependent methyltransferase
MNQVVLGLLTCPICRSAVADLGETLVCNRGHTFPVVRGIPRFTPTSSYADSFGFQWKQFPTQQLDTGNRRDSEVTFMAKTGLSPDDMKGRLVLDAGCGMGRFSEVVARWDAGQIVAVDLSQAVEVAAVNLSAYPAATTLQADLENLPFAPETFDIVFSIGVLHHTPSTERAFRTLATFVKPGGIYCVWVYSRHLRVTLAGGEIIRLFTRRMDRQKLLELIQKTEPKLSSMKMRIPALSRLIDLAIPTSNHPEKEWRQLDTFDWYSPRYQWKHSFSEVKGWYRSLGFEDIERLNVRVAVRGRRPMRDLIGEDAEISGRPVER